MNKLIRYSMAMIIALLYCAEGWAQAKILFHSPSSPLTPAPMEVVPTNAGGVVIVAQAPHSHAAVLLADYLLGPEAAKILGDLHYGSVFKPVAYKLWYPEAGMSTSQYDKAAERWAKLLRQIRKKAL